MLFGICDAPAIFMCLMSEVLLDFIDDLVTVYLDDILVYFYTWEDRLVYLKWVFGVLKAKHLKLNMKKCEVRKHHLVYLWFIENLEQIQKEGTGYQ